MSNKTAAKASDTPTSDASKKNGGNKKDAASPNGVQPEKEKVVDSASKAKSVDATTDGKSDDKEGKSGSDKGNDTEKTDSDGQDAATEEEEKAKKPAPRVLKPGEKEIRYNKKLPYKYEVSRIGELYTVVNRLGKVKEETSMKKSLQKKWAFYRKILPLLLRYVKETILPLGKRRLIICRLSWVTLDDSALARAPVNSVTSTLTQLPPILCSFPLQTSWATSSSHSSPHGSTEPRSVSPNLPGRPWRLAGSRSGRCFERLQST